MGARDDREFLEKLADEAEQLDGDDERAGRLREIAKRIMNPGIEVVEQGTLVPKSPSVPDGFSWTDLVFTGNLWGIRPSKGEPVIEQRGHLILLRQAETSFEPRHAQVYDLASSMRTEEGGRIFVAVVFGFQGERNGLVWFEDGKQLPMIPLSGASDLRDELAARITWCAKNPAGADYRTGVRKPKSRQTSLDDIA